MSSKKDEAEEEDEQEDEQEEGKDDGEGDDGMDVGGHSSAVGKKRKCGASNRGTASHSDENRADEIPPPTKKQKPLCKYGPKCYQTNPTHQELFEHPWVSLIRAVSGNATIITQILHKLIMLDWSHHKLLELNFLHKKYDHNM